MDAEYLKGSVNEALTEALSAMAAEMPEDKIEYIGRYLKAYVLRKRAFAEADEERKESESSWAAESVKDDLKKAEAKQAADAVKEKEDQLTSFLDGFEAAATTKPEAMNQATQFVSDYLGVPGSYIAIKKTINEVDTLCYVSANNGQEFVVGQKLTAPTGEEEEGVTRQGISFDAFKVPEAPEVEPPEDAPEDWAPPPPPGPQPVVVENVMRENKVKFYGIPKLGAYCAISLKFSSCDHVEGCIPAEAAAEPEGGEAPAEGEEGEATAEPAEPAAPAPKWQANKSVVQEYIIAMDTVGNYRTFTDKDIEVSKAVGEKLMAVFQGIEGKMFEAQVAFLESHVYGEKITELVTPLAEAETEAAAAAAAELTPEPAPEPAEGEEPAEVPPVSELLKACKESKAVAGVHAAMIAGDEFAPIVADMARHSLPPSPAVEKLLHVAASLVGLSAKDAGGDVSFEACKTAVLPELAAKIGSYDSEGEVAVAADTSLAALKEFVEANGVVPGEYPANLPALAPIATWVGKALAAREAAITYYTEEKQTALEK
jgi:hypothetical protein